MKYADIIAKLTKGEALTAEEMQFLQNVTPVDDVSVKDYLEKNETGKKYIQSLTDSAVTKGIETFKSKTMPSLLEDEIKKRFPGETEEQKRVRLLEERVIKAENDAKKEKLLNKALAYASEKKLPTKHLERLLGDDEEKTLAILAEYEAEFNNAVSAQVTEQFKINGREPQSGNNAKSPNPPVDYSKMSDQEFYNNFKQ